MRQLANKVKITVSDNLYLKNPETSDLGRRILAGSIDMIDEVGLERFTFRKVAESIGSTEASVYRYFENKHKLLIYLVTWYWGWMEYRIAFQLANLSSPEERLRRAIRMLTEEIVEDSDFYHVNEVKLNRIVVAESVKVYLTRDVDIDNRDGAFSFYKQLVGRIGDIIIEINPKFPYPHMLVSTIIEGGHLQRYFADHLPRITDRVEGEDSIVEFFTTMALRTIA